MSKKFKINELKVNKDLLASVVKQHNHIIKTVNERGYDLDKYNNKELVSILEAFEDISYFSKVLLSGLSKL